MKRILANLMILLGATFGLSALTASDAFAGGHGKHLNKHERRSHYSRHNDHYSGRHYGSHSTHTAKRYYRTRYDHHDHHARYDRHGNDRVIRFGVHHVHDAHCGHPSVRYDRGHAIGWLLSFGN